MLRRAGILIGVMVPLAAVAVAPYKSIKLNVERSDYQWDVGLSVYNTTGIRAWLYQGASPYGAATGYTWKLCFGVNESATQLVQVAGSSVASNEVLFAIGSNTVSKPFTRWYSAILGTKENEAHSFGKGWLTANRAPEVNAYEALRVSTPISGSAYGPFSGDFSGWPFIQAGGTTTVVRFSGGITNNDVVLGAGGLYLKSGGPVSALATDVETTAATNGATAAARVMTNVTYAAWRAGTNGNFRAEQITTGTLSADRIPSSITRTTAASSQNMNNLDLYGVRKFYQSGCYVTNQYGVALGQGSISGGNYGCMALGENCISLGDASLAFGGATRARNSYALAAGLWSEANGYCSFAFGQRAKADNTRSMVFNCSTGWVTSSAEAEATVCAPGGLRLWAPISMYSMTSTGTVQSTVGFKTGANMGATTTNVFKDGTGASWTNRFSGGILIGSASGPATGKTVTHSWVATNGVTHAQTFTAGLLTSWTTNGVELP